MKPGNDSHADINPYVLGDNVSAVLVNLFKLLFLPYLVLRTLIAKKENKEKVWRKTKEGTELVIQFMSAISYMVLGILFLLAIVIGLIFGVVSLIVDTTMSIWEKVFMAISVPIGLILMMFFVVLAINIIGPILLLVGPLWLIVDFPKIVIPIIIFYTLCITLNTRYYRRYAEKVSNE